MALLITVVAVTLALVLGAVAIAAATPTVEIELTNLSYRQNVAIKFAVKTTSLPAGATVGVSVKKGSPDATESFEATLDEVTEINGTEYHIFTVDCLTASEMAIDIYATPYVKLSGGSTVYGREKKTSILKYAYMALGKIDEGRELSAEVQTMIAAMLNYGAAVQDYTGTNTDRLANESYYQIKVVGGLLPDGHASGFYKSGESVTLTATPGGNLKFDCWKNSSGASVGTSSTLTVTASAKNEVYTAVASADTSFITYYTNGGTLPSGTSNDYTPGTAFTLPTPVKAGYVFSGWFTSSNLNIDTITTAVPTTATGEYKVYAKWNKVLFNHNSSNYTALTFGASDDSNNKLTTSGGKIIWTQSSSTASQLDLRGVNLSSLMKNAGETAITLKISLAKVSGSNTPSASFRMRRAGGNNYFVVFSTDSAGNVYLGGNTAYKIATLTTTEQEIAITMDFASGKLYYYSNDGRRMSDCMIALPTADAASYTYEQWLNEINYYGWLWYSPQGAAKLSIGNIAMHAGDSAIRTSHEGLTAEEITAAINSLKATNNAFTKAYFDTTTSTLTASSSLSMPSPSSSWGTGYQSYTLAARENGTGARLMLNSSIIQDILNTIETNGDYTAAYESLLSLANTVHDGKLPAASTHTSGRKGVHNYDGSVLGVIEAKAFMYRLMYEQGYASGSAEALLRDKYGYEAIVAMKNYLKTLDIQYISSDQCREYGYVMFIAAEVYDWCYPLLTSADKEQLIFAVVESCCSGTCGDPSYTTSATYQRKMEVGFPPSGQGSVSGHGSEAQVLRDYLSFAIAIYDEDPSWYNYVAARVVGDYAAVRKVYFASGMTQQGVSTYVAHRHYFDLYSGWIMETATGKNPYDGMETTVLSILSYTFPDDRLIFPDGDGASKQIADYARHALFSSALYSEYDYADTLFTWFANYNGLTKMSTGAQSGVTYPTFFILASQGQQVLDSKYEGLDPVNYNGAPLGQLIARTEWNNPNAAVVFMKVKERHTANHEHDDAGTFQIYYKGFLTGDSGVYDSYGNTHHSKYHKATVAHNGLLVADPAKLTGTYSGSQRQPSEASGLSSWLTSTYETGSITGVEYGYKDEAKSKTRFAYLAGDITAAYESSQASYVGRRMLAVYTDDEAFPMYFFVFDKITTPAANYKKTFLLHIRGVNEPTVNGNVVTTINENGKLVLHSLTSGATIAKVGGRVYDSAGNYDADKSMNYLINGTNCKSPNGKDDKNWGRIEISVSGSTTSTLLNAMYVTDKNNTKTPPTVTKITASGIEGAMMGNVAAMFVTSNTRTSGNVTFTTSGSGNITYYVSGVSVGEWNVKVGGVSYGKATASGDGGLLTFTAPAGKVELSLDASSNIIVKEDYSKNTVASAGEKLTVGDIQYTNADMTVCSFNTVKDTAGNYLLVETTNGAQIKAAGNLYNALDGETQVSYVLKLAKVSGKSILPLSFRIRDGKSGNNYRSFVTVDTSGNVLLGGTKDIGDLTTTLTEYRFVVDFKAGTITYYPKSGSAVTVTFTCTANATSTAEWLTMMTSYYLDAQAYQGKGALKIGEISIYRGNAFI